MKKAVKLPVATGNVPEGPKDVMKVSPSQEKEMRRYRAEDALRDLERAEAHKRDSALMKDVKAMAKDKLNSLKKLC